MDMQHALTSKAVIQEVGQRVKNYRVSRNLTQKELADRSGVSLRSISRFEQGEDFQLSSFVKILRAMDLLDNLNLLIPDTSKSPSYYLKSTTKKRVRKKKETADFKPFQWGDEQ